ncbi:hypothetical protein T479_17050 [Lysinibacillus varians]|nr:hypothetical protein T479_17050 [Lysinibacillus varians]
MTSVSKATLNKELIGAKNKKRTCVGTTKQGWYLF